MIVEARRPASFGDFGGMFGSVVCAISEESRLLVGVARLDDRAGAAALHERRCRC